MSRTAAASLLALAVSLAGVAQASAEDYRLVYHRYETQTDAGLTAVYKRIHRTADRACSTSSRKGIETLRHQKKCRAEIEADLLAKIGVPELYAFAETTPAAP